MGPGNGQNDPPKAIHPAYIYAFGKVGFILTEDNAHTFSDDDVRRWNEALAEGERIHGPVDDE